MPGAKLILEVGNENWNFTFSHVYKLRNLCWTRDEMCADPDNYVGGGSECALNNPDFERIESAIELIEKGNVGAILEFGESIQLRLDAVTPRP